MKFCPKCGANIQDGRKFCTNCGSAVEDTLISSDDTEMENNKENLENTLNVNAENRAFSENDNLLSNDASNVEDFPQKLINDDETIVDNTFVSDAVNTILSEDKTDNYSYSEDNNIRNLKEKRNYSKINAGNNERNRYNNSKQNQNVKNRNSTKIIIGSVCGIVIIAAVLIGIFFNTIRANYYMSKCTKSYITEEKLDYAEKAILCSKNNKTKAFVKQVFSSAADSDIDIAEKKLEDLSHVLDQNDYKEIAGEVKNKKLDSLYRDGRYDEALALFKDIDSLGVDFKKSSHYEEIMFNVIAKLTGTSVQNSKNNIMENQKICFDNFDDDIYDEIMEVTDGEYYGDDIKINLYKYSDGQYRQVDTKLVNNCWSPELCGVYDYDKDTCGMYLRYYSDDGEVGVGVFDIDGEKMQLKGAVFSNNYTKPDDVNNDGIYEILSNSTSMFSNSNKGTSKWYKINPDGTEPTEINGNVKSDSSSSKKQYSNDLSELKNTDYLFPQSSSEYLTDDDVKNLSANELAIARNEIFARYGYIFSMQEFADYFNSKSWYSPNPDYDGNIERLNKYEKANVELIKEYEAK